MQINFPSPNPIQKIIQRLAATLPASRLLVHSLPVLDKMLLRLSGGRWTATRLLAALPVVTLTTKGARSGKIRQHFLVGLPDGDKIVLFASNFGQKNHPAWYFNLRATPEATVSFKGNRAAYRARAANDLEREQYLRSISRFYPGYLKYVERTERKIPVMVMIPVAEGKDVSDKGEKT